MCDSFVCVSHTWKSHICMGHTHGWVRPHGPFCVCLTRKTLYMEWDSMWVLWSGTHVSRVRSHGVCALNVKTYMETCKTIHIIWSGTPCKSYGVGLHVSRVRSHGPLCLCLAWKCKTIHIIWRGTPCESNGVGLHVNRVRSHGPLYVCLKYQNLHGNMWDHVYYTEWVSMWVLCSGTPCKSSEVSWPIVCVPYTSRLTWEHANISLQVDLIAFQIDSKSFHVHSMDFEGLHVSLLGWDSMTYMVTCKDILTCGLNFLSYWLKIFSCALHVSICGWHIVCVPYTSRLTWKHVRLCILYGERLHMSLMGWDSMSIEWGLMAHVCVCHTRQDLHGHM